MKEIVLATTNKGKLEEFNYMAQKFDIKFIMVPMPEIEENGKTFEENSLIKAKAIMELTGMPVIADDSGLCVKCLNDKPGIHTARYRNDLSTYNERCDALIQEVNSKNSNRDAYFVCVITLIFPDGKYYHFKGESYGSITLEKKGTNGHGYDPVFFSPKINKTFAEASLEEKGSVSHRGLAFEKLEDFFNEYKI